MSRILFSYFRQSYIKFDNNDKKGNLGNQWQSLISSPNLSTSCLQCPSFSKWCSIVVHVFPKFLLLQVTCYEFCCFAFVRHQYILWEEEKTLECCHSLWKRWFACYSLGLYAVRVESHISRNRPLCWLQKTISKWDSKTYEIQRLLNIFRRR